MNRATAPRLTLVVGVVILLGLLYQPVAGAAPPLTETFTETFDGVQSCDGFQNVFSGEISLRVTTYFDAAESPSRVQIHATGEEIDVNSITGKSISIRGNWLIKIDLVSGTFTLAGQFIMSNEPGQGNAIHSTGRLVFDADDNAVFSAGPHEVLETNGEIFCTALS